MTHPVCFKQIMLMLVSTVDDGNEAMMKTLMRIDDKVTSDGGSEEKVAKSRGPSEGDGGGRNHVEGVHDEQSQAENMRSTRSLVVLRAPTSRLRPFGPA